MLTWERGTMLSVNNISVGYKGLLAIQDVSFEVKKGEVVSLIGSNGAGKTTLLKTILGLLKPIKGEIRLNDQPCAALEKFAREYPSITLHPEIRRLVWAYELCLSEIQERTVSFLQPFVTIDSRLKLVAENAPIFNGLSSSEANRMWHILALRMLAQNGVEGFIFFRPSHMPECDISMSIDCQTFNVKDALERTERALNKGKIVPKPLFPSYKDIDNMPTDEMKKNLLRGGWYLPPFCKECRCQILPSIID